MQALAVTAGSASARRPGTRTSSSVNQAQPKSTPTDSPRRGRAPRRSRKPLDVNNGRRAVRSPDANHAARRTLALATGFSYLPDRWHVLSVREQTAGFVLPVIYDGCALDGLDEATIYHMGVSPAHRGTGVGRLLLRHATRLLVEHGVWRIYCDTPSNNEPMIHLFESEGWTRLPAYERPIAF